jgi:hypothetical protein
MESISSRTLPTLAALTLLAGVGLSGTAAAQSAPGVCGPIDLVFVVDDTGSMGGAITNIQTDLASIIADANAASGGDLQLALVSFKDEPETDADLPSPEATVSAAIAALFASGGAGLPEASDVALDAVVNGLGACGDAFSNENFRPEAVKIAIMLTDDLPGGCDDIYTPGVDDVNAAGVANDASAADILISAIYNANSPNATVAAIMMNYATTTGGQYINTPSDGTGTAAAISEIIAACGSSANECPLSQGYWKNHLESWPVEDGLEIGGTFYTNDELLEILNTPPKRGNSNLILAHQLIAALLNSVNGSDPAPIADEVAEAQVLLAGVELPGDYQKDPRMNALAGDLDEYNNRWLTPDCEESGDDEEA